MMRMNNDNIPYGFNSEGDSIWDEPIRSHKYSELKLSKELENSTRKYSLVKFWQVLIALKSNLSEKMNRKLPVKVRAVVGRI